MSMEANITPERIANSIRMDKSFNGVSAIVEGENDFKIYKMIMKSEVVRIKRAFGKEKVKKVLKLLESEKELKVIGIIDSDFDNILGSNDNIYGLFKTDYHDIEIELFNSRALEKILYLLCDEKKIKAFEDLKKQSIREIVINIVKHIGKLKLINLEQQLQLRFKPKDKNGNTIKYKKVVSDKSGDFLGVENLIDVVINYGENRTKGINVDKLKYDFVNKDINKYNILDIINGHDMANVLYIIIKYVLKSKSTLIKDYTSIEECLILAYDTEEFLDSKLYKELFTWQNNNDLEILKIHKDPRIFEKAM